MSNTRYIDAHIHLSDPEYADCVDEVIAEARSANVVAMVSNAMDLKTCIENMRLAEKYRGLVYVALGIHPWTVQALADADLQETIDFIQSQKGHSALVAIGEIGLDSKYDKIMDRQMKVFEEMLHLAEKLNLPAVIHSRGMTEKIIELLPSYEVKKVLLHWFSNPIDALPKAIARGYYITEGPVATYSTSIQEVVRKTPLTNLMTETDGPVKYFKQPFSGKRTTSAYIPLVVKAIAEAKSINVDDVATSVLGSFQTFFGVRLN
jgi:TatD DNase family protein